MRKPSETDIGIALDWLRANEGDNGESDACQKVADWIERIETNDKIRNAARKGGIPIKLLRAALTKKARE